jgi:hypothetical protein
MENAEAAKESDYTKYVKKPKASQLGEFINQDYLADVTASTTLLAKDLCVPKSYTEVNSEVFKVIEKSYRNNDSVILLVVLGKSCEDFGVLLQNTCKWLTKIRDGFEQISQGVPNDRKTGQKVTNGIGSVMLGTDALRGAIDLFASASAGNMNVLMKALEETSTSRQKFNLQKANITKQISYEKCQQMSKAVITLIDQLNKLADDISSDYNSFKQSLKKLANAMDQFLDILNHMEIVVQVANAYHSADKSEIANMKKIINQLESDTSGANNKPFTNARADYNRVDNRSLKDTNPDGYGKLRSTNNIPPAPSVSEYNPKKYRESGSKSASRTTSGSGSAGLRRSSSAQNLRGNDDVWNGEEYDGGI